MILVDTNVLVAYWNIRDSCHDRAVALVNRISQGVYGPAFITDYVFDEAVTVCSIRTSQQDAKQFGDALLQSLRIAKITEIIFLDSWAIYKKHPRFSFTDCTNLSVMDELSIKTITTFDKEFKKIKNISVIDSV